MLVPMRVISGKYYTEGSIHRMDGGIIPDDEPVFLFRAQDKLLVEVIEHYKQLREQYGVESDAALKRHDEQIAAVTSWQKDNFTKLPR